MEAQLTTVSISSLSFPPQLSRASGSEVGDWFFTLCSLLPLSPPCPNNPLSAQRWLFPPALVHLGTTMGFFCFCGNHPYLSITHVNFSECHGGFGRMGEHTSISISNYTHACLVWWEDWLLETGVLTKLSLVSSARQFSLFQSPDNKVLPARFLHVPFTQFSVKLPRLWWSFIG